MSARYYPEEGKMAIAVIDPSLAFGEPGQYEQFTESVEDVLVRANAAKAEGKEVRLYYKGLQADGDEPVASQVIETWIPPRHVQPFHTHHRVHEMTLVMEGEILAVDDDQLDESDLKFCLGSPQLLTLGKIVGRHGMVVEGPGTRHTVVNHTDAYAVLVTVQTARLDIAEFPADWHRDKPAD